MGEGQLFVRSLTACRRTFSGRALRHGIRLMHDLFDYRVIATVFAVKSFLQALGLGFVWYAERRYAPARKWALGSFLVALGSTLVAFDPSPASGLLTCGRGLVIYIGMAVFGVGILDACAVRIRWSIITAIIGGAILAHGWFSMIQPSAPARFLVLAFSLSIGELYIAGEAIRAREGPLSGVRRLIGFLMLAQAVSSIVLGFSLSPLRAAPVLHTVAMQNLALFVVVAVSFLLVLALTILTGQRTTALLSAVLDNLDQGVAMFDEDRRLVVCNDRYGRLYGADADQLRPGTSLVSIVARRVANGIFAGPSSQRYFEEQTTPALIPATKLHHLSDGRSIVVSRRPMTFGGWLTTHSDVSAIQRIEEQVAYLAHHDPLTGLANRQLFSERLHDARNRLGHTNEGFAILLIDLDRFKAINDTLGHPSGDALLVAVAERLRSCVTDADLVARLGGDEFAIVQMTGAHRESTSELARRLLDEVGAAYDLDGQKVMVGASIGIAKAPENGTDVDQLMRNADLALYRSKAEGRNCFRFYDRNMDANIRARHALELALRNSIMCEDFLLDYQPVIDVEGERVCAAEALVRWRHPAGTIIEPSKFIGIAEETGLIGPLGEWILRQACSDARDWPDEARVSVNLSVVQFTSGNICELVETVLRETGLAPGRLELEVTESLFLHASDTALDLLYRLKALGVSIALDDFGTGYSSLNYLTKFPFDRIKIDKSFIVDLGSRTESSAVVAAIIGVARSLDMSTTAEGVETADQYELLRLAGCSEMQGYLFGRPTAVGNLTFGRWGQAEATSAQHRVAALRA